VKVGCTLPTFREGPAEMLAVAREAQDAGLDGLFVFEHLWPMGQPGRPAILGKPALAAVAAATSTITLGTLVARVGLMPDATALAEFAALELVAGDRLVAGLGVGDHKSDDEQRAYGIPLVPAAERRQSLATLAGALRRRGVEVWVGAGSRGTNATARALGAVLNLWDAPASAVAVAAREGPTSWGGPLPADPAAASDRVAELAASGASYLVWGWPPSIDLVVEAVEASGIDRS
jgi:alkanesulfonate monooxygenase SsuD/methylene tetrahydromethanopterin reductase-like flavin-dependent oxidoreductase (luciferase family)